MIRLLTRRTKKKITKDLIFLVSLIFAIYLLRSNLIPQALTYLLPYTLVITFIAGFFFTSFLTVPISMAMLIILAKTSDPLLIALVGGLGAMFGDLLLVKIFRDLVFKEFPLLTLGSTIVRFAVSLYAPFLENNLKTLDGFIQNPINHNLKFLHSNWIRTWILPVLGAAIIASPFPDEIGLVLLGASKIQYYKIALIAYVFNTIGIYLIAVSVRAL